jgi:hypothetical protein
LHRLFLGLSVFGLKEGPNRVELSPDWGLLSRNNGARPESIDKLDFIVISLRHH